MRIAFIGTGAMGGAMISALVRQGEVSPSDICACDIDTPRLAVIGETYGVECTAEGRSAIGNSDIVVLSIKPQVLPRVMNDFKGQLAKEQLVLSIVAGGRIQSIRDGLKHDVIVRAMPNTPAQVGEGMTVWTATDSVTAAQRDAVRNILAATGKELFVSDEKYIDMATAISGSGPAYVFLVMEALIDAGVHIGLPRATAQELVMQTVLGSARLAHESGRHLAELKNAVTSPGGTTAEGLLRLEEGGLRAILAQAVIAAYEKAQDLGGETGK